MLIVILVAILFIGLGCGAAFWFIFQRQHSAISRKLAKQTRTKETLPLRWRYIILPLTILTLSIILSAYCYHLLPSEVAYHFKPDGIPDRWFSRGIALVWVLVPQFILALLATAIVWGITKLNLLPKQSDNPMIRPERILSFMGNLVALPQFIVGFAMLDIFSYNVFQTHIIPMRLFLFIILGMATVGLGVFLIIIIFKAMRQLSFRPNQKT